MKKRVIGTIIAFIFALILLVVLDNPSITGFTTTSQSISPFASLGPVTVLAIIFAAGIIGLYEITRKN